MNRVYDVSWISATGDSPVKVTCLLHSAAMDIVEALTKPEVSNVSEVRVAVRPPMEGETYGR